MSSDDNNYEQLRSVDVLPPDDSEDEASGGGPDRAG